MPGSPTQKKPSDERPSSAGEQAAAAASAAPTAQEPASAAGIAQGGQGQATGEAQVGGESAEQNGQQHGDGVGIFQQTSDDGLSQIVGLSQTEEGAGEEDSAQPEAVRANRNYEFSWGIHRFMEDDDNVPVLARPPHETPRERRRFYSHRAARVISEVVTFFPLPRQ